MGNPAVPPSSITDNGIQRVGAYYFFAPQPTPIPTPTPVATPTPSDVGPLNPVETRDRLR